MPIKIEDQVANIFTKGLNSVKIEKFQKLLDTISKKNLKKIISVDREC